MIVGAPARIESRLHIAAFIFAAIAPRNTRPTVYRYVAPPVNFSCDLMLDPGLDIAMSIVHLRQRIERSNNDIVSDQLRCEEPQICEAVS